MDTQNGCERFLKETITQVYIYIYPTFIVYFFDAIRGILIIGGGIVIVVVTVTIGIVNVDIVGKHSYLSISYRVIVSRKGSIASVVIVIIVSGIGIGIGIAIVLVLVVVVIIRECISRKDNSEGFG